MKRWLKIMLVIFICATILTGIGVGLEIGIYGVQSYAARKGTTMTTFEKTFDSQDITNLTFHLTNLPLEIIPTADQTIKVEAIYPKNQGIDFSASLEGHNAVSLRQEDSAFQGLFSLFAGWGDSRVTVYCPTELSLSISGRNTSGKVSISKMVTESLDLQTTSGKIQLHDLSASETRLHATSGKIALTNSQVSGKVSATASSGKISLENLQCNSVYAKSTSGSLFLNRIQADTMELHSTSGAIEGTGQWTDMAADTTSGRIELEYTSPVKGNGRFSSTSGSIRLTIPKSSSVKVDFSSVSGRLKTEDGTRRDNTLMYGDGTHHFSIKTTSGSGTISTVQD